MALDKFGFHLHLSDNPPPAGIGVLGLLDLDQHINLVPSTSVTLKAMRDYERLPFYQDPLKTIGRAQDLAQKGFVHLRAGNEPNNPSEWGAANIIQWHIWKAWGWQYQVNYGMKQLIPGVKVHLPAMSPDAPRISDDPMPNAVSWEWPLRAFLAPTDGKEIPADVIDIHLYWPVGQVQKALAQIDRTLAILKDYPHRSTLPIFISEGGPMPWVSAPYGHRSTEAGKEIERVYNYLQNYSQFIGMALWCWDSTDVQFQSHSFKGTYAWAYLQTALQASATPISSPEPAPILVPVPSSGRALTKTIKVYNDGTIELI